MKQADNFLSNRLPQYCVLILIFCIGFFGYVMNATDWLKAIPGDLYDARFNSVILEHLFQWSKGEVSKIWSPSFFYPFENVLAFSDNHFGSGAIYILFRAFGQPREQAYLYWFIAGNVLNFGVSYYVFRRLGFSVIAAGAGAFVYAFGLPALLKEAHAQLIYRFAIPLSFLSMYQYLQNKEQLRLALTFFWLAIQFLCSIYLGIFLIYLLTALTLAYAWIDKKYLFSGLSDSWKTQAINKRVLTISLLILSVFVITALLYKYQSVSRGYGFHRTIAEILSMMPQPSSYLIADRSRLTSWIGAYVTSTPMRHEQQMFFGVGLWVLALIGIWRIFYDSLNRNLGRVAVITLLILIATTISINDLSIYKLFLYVPGVSSVRAVSRIVLVMLLPLGILVAIAIQYAISLRSKPVIRAITAIIFLLLLVSETVFYRPYSTQISKWHARQLQLKELLPKALNKDDILFVTGKPGDYQDGVIELDAMILAQDLGLATLNGYSGNFPKGYVEPYPCVSYQDRIASFFEINKNTVLDQNELDRRIKQISLFKCPVEPERMGNFVINHAIASKVILASTSEIKSDRLYIAVSITNTGDQIFSSLSSKGPVRLSWRYVPLNPNGSPAANPDWIARKNLYFVLKKDQTELEILELALPKTSGKYLFEMSLVQDGVAWFHDLGMPTSQQIIQIP